jgi:ribosome-associated protein
MDDDLAVTPELTIPAVELEWRFARSGGPGGQHVNTAATKAELRWDLAGSPSLTDDQRQRLLLALATRLGKDGVLRMVAEDRRSQLENRALARARLCQLLAAALRHRRPRRPTRPTATSQARRLTRKRQRGGLKAQRRQRFEPD